MSKTTIEWTEYSYNPITGCSHAGSPGCDLCYARRMARRLAGRYGYPEAPHHFDVTLHPDRLEQPARWSKPRMVFVCSMSDLFHKDVPQYFISRVFKTMAACPQHTFQVLTKRAGLMRMFFVNNTNIHGQLNAHDEWVDLPLPNVWLGVSVENQTAAEERREYLRQIPAAIKFVSYEPALAPVNWAGWEFVDQIISGGESGPRARPSHPNWHRAARDFCQENGIAYFFKQHGAWKPIEETNEKLQEWADKPLSSRFCWLHFKYGQPTMGGPYSDPGWQMFERVGKKCAGRLLDGQLWEEYPRRS